MCVHHCRIYTRDVILGQKAVQRRLGLLGLWMFGLGLDSCGLGRGFEDWCCVKTIVFANIKCDLLQLCSSCHMLLPSFDLLLLTAVCGTIYDQLFPC